MASKSGKASKADGKRSSGKGAKGAKGAKAEVEQLRSRLEKAEGKADRWKARAGRYEKDAVELRAELKKVTERLDEAASRAAGTAADTAVGVDEADEASEAAPVRPTEPAHAQPDSSWTVVRLRAEARSRGITGVTTKPKAELLALLTD